MRNILIDCDPGHDDAIAILLALGNKEKLNIKGITTVAGNQTVDKVTNNALKILEFIGEDIPVAVGATKPVFNSLFTGAESHGSSGMDGPELMEPKIKPIDKNAIEFMREVVSSSDEPVTLVALGPLTNIGLFLLTYPELKEKIEMISLMGGAYEGGNVTSCAEFNIYVDPEAAKMVFNSGVPIVMSGLDIAREIQIFDYEIEKLKDEGKVSNLVRELLEFYSIASKRFGFEGSPLYDVSSVAYLLNPEIFTLKHCKVDVETKGELTRGMTVVDIKAKEEEKNAYVMFDANREVFSNMIFESLKVLDKRVGKGDIS
ncbi:nucleoside hydrolase [Sporanaerobacter acetigenes]|uniref:Pyrimidine-specific ribonucleoside hydrolase n=1 Tax=Sporanaerobacter acetigenes DSM 13106 TaxID=1123281 RepID=A0A1M5VCE9_9FIRM|nr:nucleoside hydrolase [Sporanaerobacter acetigenes]SHH72828.1 pyrimidine-specific ribonucleoside hydrolase [Sporanaerobacter acetigenes DSM 13106]